MVELHELLAKMGMPLTDKVYSSYICTSLCHIPTFQNLFTSIDVVTETSNMTLPPLSLINCVHSQWRGDKVTECVEQLMEGTALVAKQWKGKGKGKQPDKKKKSCKNCGKKGHTGDECFADGGGQADKAPNWFKDQQKRAKEKEKKSKDKEIVGTASKEDDDESDSSDSEHAALAWSHIPTHALICIPNLLSPSIPETATAASSDTYGEILDMGASIHFSAEHERFINLQPITPSDTSLVRTADGHLFCALGK